MTLSFFDQFMIPQLMGMPLIIPAMFFPLLLLPQTPRMLQNRMHTIMTYITQNFTKQLLLPLNLPAHKWANPLTSLMILLASMNLLGLLPYTFTPTTQLSINMALAIPLWLTTVLIGFRTQPTNALGHMLPEGTPTPLIPMLVLIETISLLIRPLALGVRLTANLTAGHLLLQLISTATLALLPTLPSIAILITMVLILLTLLELAVALIQAYVFVLLLSLYLQENT
uniref:ATP synthase subunit a n=1 Tax=Diplometopon zarudnyi TaxID=94420 RepID=Q66SX2_DIPZA|nr:ATP synthase F0 subunit 6 [Diplometopon zarudnyi]AAT08508.1 ATP synthase F0 subunit 6 [Diplometopon zarudnyi]